MDISFSGNLISPAVKLLIITFLLVTMLPLISRAQVLRLGPKAGVQVSRLLHDEAEYLEEFERVPALGFSGGLVLNTKVSDRFSLQSEFLFERVGKHVKSKLVPGDFLREQNDYLSVPLLLRYTQKFGYTEAYFNVGPDVSYWLGGNGLIRNGEVLENGMEEMPYSITFDRETEANDIFVVPDPNRFQLGLQLGAGALLPMGSNFLMLDLRYHWGHTNLARSGQGYIPIPFFNDDLRHSHQSLEFSVAFLFEFDIYTMSTKGKSTGSSKKE